MHMDRRKFLNLGSVGISSFTLTGFIPASTSSLNSENKILKNNEKCGFVFVIIALVIIILVIILLIVYL